MENKHEEEHMHILTDIQAKKTKRQFISFKL